MIIKLEEYIKDAGHSVESFNHIIGVDKIKTKKNKKIKNNNLFLFLEHSIEMGSRKKTKDLVNELTNFYKGISKNITIDLALRILNVYINREAKSTIDWKCRRTANIYKLELISSYRGWRHFSGLPVRGQRTWTNGWSVYKSNLCLREFIVALTKNIYASSVINLSTARLAYLAEHINKLWSIQWEKEWKSAKKKRVEALKRSSYKEYVVDISRLSSGNVNSKKVRKNRKKEAAEKKNIFYLGFDKGFTKYLLKHNKLEYTTIRKPKKNKENFKESGFAKKKMEKKKKGDKFKIIYKQESKTKTKKKQVSKAKKLEVAAKKRKNLLLKKKKKSVWD